MLDIERAGVNIPGSGVVIVKDEHRTHLLLTVINVVTACWDVMFKLTGKSAFSAFSSRQMKDRPVWRDVFGTCHRSFCHVT